MFRAIRESPLTAACYGEVSELVEGARLETVCGVMRYRGFESLPLRHCWKVAGSQCRMVHFFPVPMLVFVPYAENDYTVLYVHKYTNRGASYG